MKRIALVLTLLVAPLIGWADTTEDMIDDIVDTYVLPKFGDLSENSAWLAMQAQIDCSSNYVPLTA